MLSWNLQPDLIDRALAKGASGYLSKALTGREIVEGAFISINSVKTYIRSAYRKIEVTRRSQAVRWGMQNGFEPDTVRVIDPHLMVPPSRTGR